MQKVVTRFRTFQICILTYQLLPIQQTFLLNLSVLVPSYWMQDSCLYTPSMLVMVVENKFKSIFLVDCQQMQHFSKWIAPHVHTTSHGVWPIQIMLQTWHSMPVTLLERLVCSVQRLWCVPVRMEGTAPQKGCWVLRTMYSSWTASALQVCS